jgi:putative SOS response-associated peptidase YedK
MAGRPEPETPAMTVLYRLDADSAALGREFRLDPGRDPWERGTIAPGRFAPVITAGREAPAGPRPDRSPVRLVPRLWGVPPPPAAGDPARPVLTIRNPESPFWIGNLRNSEFRCLVPATAVHVWGRVDPATGRRRPHWLACADQPLFAMAAVWKDSEVPAFALATTEANALFRSLGAERMPVILRAEDRRTWLRADWERAARLIAPYAGSAMREG